MDPTKTKGSTTTDGKPPDPGWEHGPAAGPVNAKSGLHRAYYVLSEEQRAKGFVRPVRRRYQHLACGTVTTMGPAIAETYARDPAYYGETFCAGCRSHYRVGVDGEFEWLAEDGGGKVGT